MLTGKCVRGCGTRDRGGTYLCSGQSLNGQPIESFIMDPAKLWPGEWHRGFTIVQGRGCNHVAIFISKEDYPSPWSFVEEVRRFGASRKVTPHFPFHLLTPGCSRMLFVHNWGYIDKELHPWGIADRDAPLDKHCRVANDIEGWKYTEPGWHPVSEGEEENKTACTFFHQDLAWWLHQQFDTANYVKGPGGSTLYTIKMPGFSFKGIAALPGFEIYTNPVKLKEFLFPGIFLSLPLTHIEYPHLKGKSAEAVNKAGYDYYVLDY